MKKYNLFVIGSLLSCFLLVQSHAESSEQHVCLATKTTYQSRITSAMELEIAKNLGWIQTHDNRCNGYYLEAPFLYPENENLIQLTSQEGILFSQKGTSVSQGKITITRARQQIIANKAYLYRDPATGKIISIDLIDHVILRQPNDLVLAQTAHYNWEENTKEFYDILYRMAIYSTFGIKASPLDRKDIKVERKITQLSAWGRAKSFIQNKPNVFVFEGATYSTCPPLNNVWKVKAEKITLNKETGRGVAKHASIFVKNMPVFYTPFLNFPIDDRRQTGFLWPIFGTSSKSGAYFAAPFYWNLAPNYDTTLTPRLLAKRGVQLTDEFRYLTPTSYGEINIAALPNDRMFKDFQKSSYEKYNNSGDPFMQAELNRLENASSTRKAFSWNDTTQFNEHWFGDIDYSYVSDDYYFRDDLNNNLNAVTQNQLLQQGELKYKGPNWNFLTRIQGYQTLHPLDEAIYQNQYTRLPQLALDGEYPDSYLGLNYFIANDATHFVIRKTPGSSIISPIGNRYNVQPGISKHYYSPYFYFDPRVQFAGTQYELSQVNPQYSSRPSRALPIFDISSGLNFDRSVSFFHHSFKQTLEPKFYYTFIPYRNQNQIPIFDTTVNTLTYDQLFTYNRFSGIDRIGDANQIALGLMSRFIDQDSGFEKIRLGLGEIFYFRDRKVTLCSDATCSNVPLCTGTSCVDNPQNPNNRYPRSPIAGVFVYNVDKNWSATADIIWSSKNNRLDNQTFTLHYQPSDAKKIVNLSYSYVRQGDIILAPDANVVAPSSGANNLSQTDFSFSWPLFRDWSMVGRWTQNWNHQHFQNLLYGLQYDSCCWAARFVTGRAFTNLNPNNTPQYNSEFFVQFALKGLGNIGSRDPTQRLNSSISGYQSTFGQDF